MLEMVPQAPEVLALIVNITGSPITGGVPTAVDFTVTVKGAVSVPFALMVAAQQIISVFDDAGLFVCVTVFEPDCPPWLSVALIVQNPIVIDGV
jgi:hypothetical protein